MLKKAFWMLMLIGFAGVLIFGAINRTQARANEGGEGATTAQGAEGGGATQMWLTRTGVATAVDGESLWVALDSGEQLEIGERSWEYAQQAGFGVQSGDRLEIVGFEEGEDVFEVGAITNLSSQQSIQIRNPETGRPMWAGRGRLRQ